MTAGGLVMAVWPPPEELGFTARCCVTPDRLAVSTRRDCGLGRTTCEETAPWPYSDLVSFHEPRAGPAHFSPGMPGFSSPRVRTVCHPDGLAYLWVFLQI